MPLTLFYTKKMAKAFGCTRRAWMFGIVPGYFNEDTGLWVPASDLLVPAEIALELIWVFMRRMRGKEPDFMFAIGKEI